MITIFNIYESLTVIPAILTAKTQNWFPQSSADGRRRNEKRHHTEVAIFFRNLGFKITPSEVSSDYTNGTLEHRKFGTITFSFYYRETTGHVYKTLSIHRNGKLSNMTLIKKLIQKEKDIPRFDL